MEGVSVGELMKQYGAIALFFPLFIYLLKFILDNYKADIESRMTLAAALDKLSERIVGPK